MDDEKEKKFKIFVNEDEHEIDTHKISYVRVVDLYLGEGGAPSKEYLVKYSHGPLENPLFVRSVTRCRKARLN